MSKSDVLRDFRLAFDDLARLLKGLPEARVTEDAVAGWSVRDILAHFAGYHHDMAIALEHVGAWGAAAASRTASPTTSATPSTPAGPGSVTSPMLPRSGAPSSSAVTRPRRPSRLGPSSRVAAPLAGWRRRRSIIGSTRPMFEAG